MTDTFPLPRVLKWICTYMVTLGGLNATILYYINSHKTALIGKKVQDKNKVSVEVSTRLTSVINSVVMCYFSYICYRADPVLKVDPIFGATDNHFRSACIAMGYSLYDTGVLFVRHQHVKRANAATMPAKIKELEAKIARKSEEGELLQKELDLIHKTKYSKSGRAKGLNMTHFRTALGHHFFVVMMCLSGCFTGTWGYHGSGAIAFWAELTGPLTNAVWLLRTAGFKTTSIPYRANGILMLLTFPFIRVVILGYYVLDALRCMYREWPRLIARPFTLFSPPGYVLLYAVGLLWTKTMLKKAMREVSRSSKSKKKE